MVAAASTLTEMGLARMYVVESRLCGSSSSHLENKTFQTCTARAVSIKQAATVANLEQGPDTTPFP